MKPIPISSPESSGGEHAVQTLTVEAARQRLIAEVTPVSVSESVALRNALGRVLAEDVHSPIDVPAHTNSAMDGYALRANDVPAHGTASLHVIGTAMAGAPFTGTVNAGECLRIMTGAPLPAGADTVVMQEQVQRQGEHALIGAGHGRGENVRAAGEDLAKGQLALAAGHCMQPADLGLLASLGRAEVRVTRRLRVAFFSTGDELRSIGEPLGPGQIYDSNRYTLYGMLVRLGVEIIDMGVVRDERAALRRAFVDAADAADAIVTSGGVSVGEADYVKETLDALGEIRFWRIAMKPGRPLAFGRVGTTAFFGLPGNPVSVMVTFYQFVEPALRRMMGQSDPRPAAASFKVRCVSRLYKRAGRTEFQRGVLERDDRGELVVRTAAEQGSGILRSMSTANCFVVLSQDSGNVEPGTLVDVQPFYGVL